mmetsp:Transcript_20219/g.47793  ORF Transcript_20219/g.47793 Transcript_20219/m.47793 type:complete len:80 (+) Transcript_20219:68-307(+)
MAPPAARSLLRAHAAGPERRAQLDQREYCEPERPARECDECDESGEEEQEGQQCVALQTTRAFHGAPLVRGAGYQRCVL